VLVHAAAVAKAVRPSCFVIEIQFLEAQIESPNYFDNQLVVLFSFMGTFSHCLSLPASGAFYLFDSCGISSKTFSCMGGSLNSVTNALHDARPLLPFRTTILP
jgi:hypothetical protein